MSPAEVTQILEEGGTLFQYRSAILAQLTDPKGRVHFLARQEVFSMCSSGILMTRKSDEDMTEYGIAKRMDVPTEAGLVHVVQVEDSAWLVSYPWGQKVNLKGSATSVRRRVVSDLRAVMRSPPRCDTDLPA